jgi:PKD repeat protein
MPTIAGENVYCYGQTVELEAGNLGGFVGSWTNTDCPQPPCIGDLNNPYTFVWSSIGSIDGSYTVEYTGECLDTAIFEFTVYPLPLVEWEPIDESPCLNECLDVSWDVLDNYTTYQWYYTSGGDSTLIENNELCLFSVNDPMDVEICLWADIQYILADTLLVCMNSDCHQVTPVESPGQYPVLPDVACPSEVIDLEVNFLLYDDCTFIIGSFPWFEDCNTISIDPTWYGTFVDTLMLSYSGCQDTLIGQIEILQAPNASLLLEYDPCVLSIDAQLIDVEGDALSFEWDIYDNPGNSYNYLLTDNFSINPQPNPIPLNELNLYSDSTFYFAVDIWNICETVTLIDSVTYISPPDIDIDIAAGNVLDYCFPETFQFEIFEFATNNIDSVFWDFGDEYGNASISEILFENTLFPPQIEYSNIGIVDTVTVWATAWNVCGSDSDSITFILYPPDVYLEMPNEVAAVCPGETIEITPLLVEGYPWGGCTVTIEPEIPGFYFECIGELNGVEIFFPLETSPGVYIITTEIFGCGSDADVTTIQVYELPNLSFNVPLSTCTGEPVSFTNTSFNAIFFEWNFGDLASGSDNSSTDFSPIHVYQQPGIYFVSLTATSPDGCQHTIIQEVEISGPDPTIDQGNLAICSGDNIQLTVANQGEMVSLLWTLTAEGHDTLFYAYTYSINPELINSSNVLETWEVQVSMTDLNGCSSQFTGQIFVKPVPTAMFDHSPIENCAQGEEVNFYNQSTPNTSSSWDFGDPSSGDLNSSDETHPTHFYWNPGNYVVWLVVVNSFNCPDSHHVVIPCSDYEIYVPNAFSPDNNLVNELFFPVIEGIEHIRFYKEDDYLFQIFDRWDNKIFETHDTQEGWNGSYRGGDYFCQPDVYIWRVVIEFPSGRKEELVGHVTLIR